MIKSSSFQIYWYDKYVSSLNCPICLYHMLYKQYILCPLIVSLLTLLHSITVLGLLSCLWKVCYQLYVDVLSFEMLMYISWASGQWRPDCSKERPGRCRKSVSFEPYHRRVCLTCLIIKTYKIFLVLKFSPNKNLVISIGQFTGTICWAIFLQKSRVREKPNLLAWIFLFPLGI